MQSGVPKDPTQRACRNFAGRMSGNIKMLSGDRTIPFIVFCTMYDHMAMVLSEKLLQFTGFHVTILSININTYKHVCQVCISIELSELESCGDYGI